MYEDNDTRASLKDEKVYWSGQERSGEKEAWAEYKEQNTPMQNDELMIHYSLGFCSLSKHLKVNKGHKQRKVIIGCEIWRQD